MLAVQIQTIIKTYIHIRIIIKLFR